MKKIIEPTGEVCVKFTEEEMASLNIEPGDKFSIKLEGEGILLQKYVKIDIDMSEWPREVLEMLIKDSCEKDISVNDVISQILENILKEK